MSATALVIYEHHGARVSRAEGQSELPRLLFSEFPSVLLRLLPSEFPSVLFRLFPSEFPSVLPSEFPSVLFRLLPSEFPSVRPVVPDCESLYAPLSLRSPSPEPEATRT